LEKNFWDNALEVFILNIVAKFYKLNPKTLQFISTTEFLAIKFFLIIITLKYNNLGREVDIKKPTYQNRRKWTYFFYF